MTTCSSKSNEKEKVHATTGATSQPSNTLDATSPSTNITAPVAPSIQNTNQFGKAADRVATTSHENKDNTAASSRSMKPGLALTMIVSVLLFINCLWLPVIALPIWVPIAVMLIGIALSSAYAYSGTTQQTTSAQHGATMQQQNTKGGFADKIQSERDSKEKSAPKL
jgi:hypothetical protein